MTLDDKLKEILTNEDFNAFKERIKPAVAEIKQAFTESGEWVHVNASQETQAAIANTMLGNKVMTGQEWFDRFVAEMENTPAQISKWVEAIPFVAAAKRGAGLE